MDCNDTKVFLSEWYRMCCSFDGNEINCPVTLGCGVIQCHSCRHLAMTGGDIIDIVQEWSDGHQVRTQLSVFLEKFPNATINSNGYPAACAGNIFGHRCDYGDDCSICWDTPIEDIQGVQ